MKVQMRNRQYSIPLYYIFLIFFSALKIVLMGLFSSDYQNELFYPFVQDFLKNGGNVYERFYRNGVTNAFPYPCIMLLVQCLGGGIIKTLSITNVFAKNFFFKLPSLILDLIGCAVLSKMCGEKRRYIAVLYYASPIILYSVYMHGQLDLIPTVFLIISIYFLVECKSKRWMMYSVIFIVLALLSKLHILAVIPIFFLYINRRDGIRKALHFVLAVCGGILAGFLPFFSDGFVNSVLLNAEQSVLTKVVFDFSTVSMYIPIVAVLMIYLITFKLNYINYNLFINLCGIMFAVFLVLCPPMPGWYVWIVPLLALFLANSDTERYKNIIVLSTLYLWYTIYFLFMHEREYVDLYFLKKDLSCIKIHESTFSNMFFTLMAGTLLYFVYSMYQTGVASNSFYQRKGFPFTLGISGDSGAGKSTMIGVVERLLGKSNLLFIEGDGDHKWERGNKYWNDYTALNPKANFIYKQAEDLRQLRAGIAVKRGEYDHNTGKFTSPKKIRPRRYVVLCGLHALYLPQVRKNLDLAIYMDSDETLRRYWKIQRDTAERGHSKEEVLRSIEARMPDAEKYIYPQKEYADLVVHYYDKNLTDCMAEDYKVRLSIKLSVNVAVNIEPLLSELRKYGIATGYEFSDNLRRQVVYLDADNLEEMTLPVDRIASNVIVHLEEITRERFGEDISGKDGIIILFLLLLISNKMRGLP